jgi:hypothetical protein
MRIGKYTAVQAEKMGKIGIKRENDEGHGPGGNMLMADLSA